MRVACSFMQGGPCMHVGVEEPERWLRVSEFCTRMALGERYVRQMIADGRLQAVRLKGLRAIRIPASEIARLAGHGK